jgi:zinc and cadmium transporter
MFTLLLLYCIAIAIVSVLGGLVPLVFRLTHVRLQVALSFVSGVLIGVALLHMLPHALEETSARSGVFLSVVIGFLVMFLLERFFCFHHHEHSVDESTGQACSHGNHAFGWVGTLVGMSIHTLIAGIALGAATAAAYSGATNAGIAGFGTFLAILLHKPFDALTITTLMRADDAPRTRAMLVNGLFALVVPVGVVLVLFVEGVADMPHLTAWALAFSAGTFLCIGCADLLPELQFHRHDRVLLSVALLLGFCLAWGSGLLEAHEHADVHDHYHDHHLHQTPDHTDMEAP